MRRRAKRHVEQVKANEAGNSKLEMELDMNRIGIMATTLALGVLIGSMFPSTASTNHVSAAPPALGGIEQGSWWKNAGSRFVFFAVMEGLYNDGVSDEIVDVVIPWVTPDPTEVNPAPAPYRDTNANFINTCPMCHPAFEAFLIYESRDPFRGQKGTRVDTFGTGLPQALVKKLKSKDGETRRKGLEQTIQRWVQQRIDRSKFSKQEKNDLIIELKLLKKAGLESLGRFKKGNNGNYFKNLYGTWKSCPICEGGFGAVSEQASRNKPVEPKNQSNDSPTSNIEQSSNETPKSTKEILVDLERLL